MPIELELEIDENEEELNVEVDETIKVIADPKVIKPLTITENGTYDTRKLDKPFDGANPVTVKIPTIKVEPLSVNQNGVYEGESSDGEKVAYSPVTVDVEFHKSQVLKEFVDLKENADYLFYNTPRYKDEDFASIFAFDVTENAKSVYKIFEGSHLVTIPPFDISKVTSLSCAFRLCTRLVDAPMLDTKHIQDFGNVFNQNTFIGKIPAWDVRSGTNFASAFNSSLSMTEIWFKNIKSNIQVASGAIWGHNLTLESLIHLIRELRDTGELLTFTVGIVNLEKLKDIYVKTVEITDEMRAEDDLIDEKLPFVVCESTDEGATLITEYALFKNWQIR